MDAEFRSFLNEFGIPNPLDAITDKDPPEPVDVKRIQSLRNGELTAPEAEWVAFLISQYKVWFDAASLLLEDSGPQRRIREHLEKVIAPFLRGERPLEEFNNRKIVNQAFRQIIGDSDLPIEVQLEFYRIAGQAIADGISKYAEQVVESQVTDTVSASIDETTMALSASQPARVLSRRRGLEELEEINSRQALIYSLSTFAGRTSDEISGLLQLTPSEVAHDLQVATIEVCLAEHEE